MVLGSFYFQRTTNGNLVGEFMNNESTRVATESANFIGEHHESFVGDYQTTWFEGKGQTMVLSITIKNINLNILRLKWSVNDNVHFVGEGFITNNMLIGVYCDGEFNEKSGSFLTR